MNVITLLIAAVVTSPGPVRYELTIDRSEYKVGEPISATLTAKNESNKDIVLAKALWDGAPAASADASLYREGKRVETYGESSMPMAQVMVDNRVNSSRFHVLKPGERVILYTMRFQGEWDFGTDKTRGKAAYGKATQKKIAAGGYECKVTYAFEPGRLEKMYSTEWEKRIAFGPGAESLWKRAEKGNIKLARSLVIRQ